MLTVVYGDKRGGSIDTLNFDRIHCRLYALGLIILWLRFMRSCRVFRTLGPFIAILGKLYSKDYHLDWALSGAQYSEMGLDHHSPSHRRIDSLEQ